MEWDFNDPGISRYACSSGSHQSKHAGPTDIILGPVVGGLSNLGSILTQDRLYQSSNGDLSAMPKDTDPGQFIIQCSFFKPAITAYIIEFLT